MSLNLGTDVTHADESIVDINTTPLIDVMLVLLIMLIITIPLQTHSVSIDLPQGKSPPGNIHPQTITLDINYDDSLSWNGTLLTSEEDLQTHLHDIVSQNNGNETELHIHPDRLANYKTVAHILASAQKSGIKKLGIIGLDQFMEGQ
ncbi:biopolymer transporter ExbD [Aristophania vespae]|uniref:Biopolymer transporter ExbD n=1 Tax=Aristophania vespae TaxID=2697033 RepID=A0A6P1NCP0_9PROT|nr:biopolymer transporter ExbD [Aristophania vespae]QHI96086.1 biopolymer transporter ExbD [Aristophania vespae]UMM63852.1 Biopolymer transport protein ExbD [Aristophania vespae]